MRELKEILRDSGFRFNKGFGQNFISDGNLLNAIVADAGITSGDTVVEVGPGGGTLTRALSRAAKKVIAYEIDENLKPVLAEMLADCDNVEVVFRDFLKINPQEVAEQAGGAFKVVANLPYYITTPVLMRFLEENLPVVSVTVMVQKEVAERFIAQPGTPEYGAVTVAIDARGTAKIMRPVSRKLFYPVPNVDSAIVRIDIADKYGIRDFPAFRRVVQAAFAMRRKTMVNNLISSFGVDRPRAEQAMARAGLDKQCRGETLSTRQLIALSESVANIF